MQLQIEDKFLPLIGEIAWHSIIVDPRIADESKRHLDLVKQVLNQHPMAATPLHVLEIACYAHTTGYDLVRELGAQVTLFEISRHSLRMGKNLGDPAQTAVNPRLIAGDFHCLPFADHSFDLVYICSALHHTWNFQTVLREMIRVLVPGGLLFLENEPTLRHFCFYKFRCNRPHELTPFETKLCELGLIRTIAEPYVGSRPEALFDMVENQKIPLPELVDICSEMCRMESFELFPEQCMGNFETFCLTRAQQHPDRLSELLFETLQDSCQAASLFLTEREKGMGFSLPCTEELRTMSEALSQTLLQLPADTTTPEYRFMLSQIFGSPVRLVIRKQPSVLASRSELQSKAEQFNAQHDLQGHVYNGFPEAIRPLIDKPSLIPSIHTATNDQLTMVFPASDWSLFHDPKGYTSIVNLHAQPVLQLPTTATINQNVLIVMRIYCSVKDNHFYRLSIFNGSDLLFTHRVFQAESRLFKSMLPAAALAKNNFQLQLTLAPENSAIGNEHYSVAISHIGYFCLAA